MIHSLHELDLLVHLRVMDGGSENRKFVMLNVSDLGDSEQADRSVSYRAKATCCACSLQGVTHSRRSMLYMQS